MTDISHVSTKPWSNYSESDYTLEQWYNACLIRPPKSELTSKSQCKLPIKTPNGVVNRNGVFAAAAALAGARSPINASSEEKAKAARALVRHYREMDKEPPASLLKFSHSDISDELIHYGVKGMKWGVRRSDAELANARGKKKLKEEILDKTVGARQTSVTTKSGEIISITKEPPTALAMAVGRMTGRQPPDYISTMNINDSSGKKVGSFQIWKEEPGVVRGEWLTVKQSSQGRGYSRAAIEGLLAAAQKDPEIKTVKMEVPAEAAAARHIYRSLGFESYKVLGTTTQFGVIEDWKKDVT